MRVYCDMVEGTMLFRAVMVEDADRVVGQPCRGHSVAEAVGNLVRRHPQAFGITSFRWADADGGDMEPFRELFERPDGTPTTCDDDENMSLPADDEMGRVLAQRRTLPEGHPMRLTGEGEPFFSGIVLNDKWFCGACGKPLSGKACTNAECPYAPPVEDQKAQAETPIMELLRQVPHWDYQNGDIPFCYQRDIDKIESERDRHRVTEEIEKRGVYIKKEYP